MALPKWTDERTDALTNFVGDESPVSQATVAEAADQLETSTRSVSSKLRKMGFDVKDLDQSTGLLFVQYNGAEQSWWSGLFGSEDELDIEKSEYRLKLEGLGDKTAVTFMDNESKPFSAKQVTKIFAPFKNYMGNEDLDI